jgi:hypothetical protein
MLRFTTRAPRAPSQRRLRCVSRVASVRAFVGCRVSHVRAHASPPWPQVAGRAAAALARNAELEALDAALAAAEAPPTPALGAPAEAAAAAACAGAVDDDDPEAAGEGDLEDDFILAVLDAEGSAGASEEEEEEEEEEISDAEEEEEEGDDAGAPPPQDALAAAAAAARAARPLRPLDAAFEALAAEEYSDTDIGCAPAAVPFPLSPRVPSVLLF